VKFLSIVIPVYNEEESISHLCQEVQAMAISQEYEVELIIVDDGSTDQTFLVSKKI
jgi:glycosyltransferase involved in cell wall biosynthesis